MGDCCDNVNTNDDSIHKTFLHAFSRKSDAICLMIFRKYEEIFDPYIWCIASSETRDQGSSLYYPIWCCLF